MTATAPQHSSWRWWFHLTAPVLALAALAGGALAIDRDVVIAVAHQRIPRLVQEFCMPLDSYGHLVGISFVAVAVWLLLPNGSRVAALIMGAAVAGGCAANCIKLCVLRWRPRDILGLNSVWDSFADTPHGTIKLQSFPSAHTALAFAATVVLVAVLPKARWLLWTLAAGVAAARVLRLAHFPSDVLAGAALGYAVGYLIVHAGAGWLRHSSETPAGVAGDLEPLAAGIEPAGTSCPILPTRRAG